MLIKQQKRENLPLLLVNFNFCNINNKKKIFNLHSEEYAGFLLIWWRYTLYVAFHF